jgi:hypothetical protein
MIKEILKKILGLILVSPVLICLYFLFQDSEFQMFGLLFIVTPLSILLIFSLFAKGLELLG